MRHIPAAETKEESEGKGMTTSTAVHGTAGTGAADNGEGIRCMALNLKCFGYNKEEAARELARFYGSVSPERIRRAVERAYGA